jgi:hypothetical protein
MSPRASLDGTPPVYPTEVRMISQMRQILPKAFPVLMNRNKWSHPWGVSKPWPTPMRAGSPAGGHFGGRSPAGKIVKATAAEIYLDADKPSEERLGDLLFEAFKRHWTKLGLFIVVWNKQKALEVGPVKTRQLKTRMYPENPSVCTAKKMTPARTKGCFHRDHLHVEFSRQVGEIDISAELEKIRDEVKAKLDEAAE